MRAIYKGTVIAESDDIVMVEGNAYFPREALLDQFVEPSSHTSRCFWKGTAHYLTIVVHNERNPNAAWFYPDPLPDAAHVKDRVAFWKGVEVK
jgi:uncharacterized protein (DUF427 family)